LRYAQVGRRIPFGAAQRRCVQSTSLQSGEIVENRRINGRQKIR